MNAADFAPLTDGVVTLRPQHVDDLDADLEAKDDEQIRWLWQPGERESWEAMTPDEQREHARRWLQGNHDTFGGGPKWTFAVDAGPVRYVAYIDCDLANEHVPQGEANIGYSVHPAHRGRGYMSRAVRLMVEFLRANTAAPRAHLVIDAENAASLRVAAAIAADETERFTNKQGRTQVRYVIPIGREPATD